MTTRHDCGQALEDALSAARLLLGRLLSFELSRPTTSEEQEHRVEVLQDLRDAIAQVGERAHEIRMTQLMFASAEARKRFAHGTQPIDLHKYFDDNFDDETTSEQLIPMRLAVD
ncbi:MAG: hypothetical protein AB7P03_11210 [Kofleriaceae bacterium]